MLYHASMCAALTTHEGATETPMVKIGYGNAAVTSPGVSVRCARLHR
jgi:hypothetical protein